MDIKAGKVVKEDNNPDKENIENFKQLKCKVRCACCYAYRKDFPDRKYFKFPKDPDMCKKWVAVCNRPYLMKKTPQQLQNSYKICSIHFLEKDFKSEKFCQLVESAYPSQFSLDDHSTDSSSLNLDLSSIKHTLYQKLNGTSGSESNVEMSLSQISDSQTLSEARETTSDSSLTVFNQLENAQIISEFDGPEQVEKPTMTSTPKRKLTFPIDTSNKRRKMDGSAPDNGNSETEIIDNSSTPRTVKKSMRVVTPKTRKIKILSSKLYYSNLKLKKSENIKNKEKFVLSVMKKLIPAPVYSFIEAQLEGKHVSPYGRRWSIHNKNLAVQIYLASPKAYNVLRKKFLLPSKGTLLRTISDISIEPGFSSTILNALKFVSPKMKEYDRLCVISFDEMKLKADLSYNEKLDSIIGYENYGIYGGNSSELATHALVFMVRGICKKWKQVFGCFFSADAAPAAVLKKLVTGSVKNIIACGLKPVAIVCDQSVSNQNLYNIELAITQDKPYFEVENHKIYAIADPPHLLKSVRNNFKNYDVTFKSKNDCNKTASWSHIVKLYHFDSSLEHRTVPKLTRAHIYVNNLQKMRVCLAAQVLSHSVAGSLNFLTAANILPSSAAHTAEFCAEMNKLFDSVTSRMLRHKTKPLLSAVTEKSDHLKVWEKGVEMIGSMKFITEGKTKRNGEIKFPSLQGWITTLKAFQEVIPEVQKTIPSVQMCRFTQDALENFFSQIRRKGGNNDHPTAAEFLFRMRMLLAQNFLSTCEKANCEPDKDVNLLPIEILSAVSQNDSEASSESLFIDDAFLNGVLEINENHCLLSQNSAAYVAGYIVKGLKMVRDCNLCKMLITQEKGISLATVFLQFKEYEGVTTGLCNPSDKFITIMCDLGKNFHTFFKAGCSLGGIKRLLIEKLRDINHDELACPEHNNKVWSAILEMYVKLMIRYQLKYLSKNRKNKKKAEKKIKKLH